LHEDIEYISRENGECVFHLKNGEKESVNKTLNKLSSELGMKYFVKCGNDYIVNIFNVVKLNKPENFIKLESGTILHIKEEHFTKLFKAYFYAIGGLTSQEQR